jgi:hypothetical protein
MRGVSNVIRRGVMLFVAACVDPPAAAVCGEFAIRDVNYRQRDGQHAAPRVRPNADQYFLREIRLPAKPASFFRERPPRMPWPNAWPPAGRNSTSSSFARIRERLHDITHGR